MSKNAYGGWRTPFILLGVVVWLVIGYTLVACNTTPEQSQEQFMVMSVPEEVDTLDPHKSFIDSVIRDLIGASLVALDEEGEIVPYLAERWEQSEDGLTWTFHLKSGITFHDGTPFTAQDYVYTFDRAQDPELGGAVAQLLAPVASYEAPNATTLIMTLHEPFFPFLRSLALPGYMMPLSQAEVEQQGEAYDRHPMSVGPYRFKEWREDGTIILERNSDFRWGPAYAPPGPYTLERIEFRVIPDPSDQLAALEAGEIDMLRLDPQHMRQAQPLLEKYTLYEYLLAGAAPMGGINASKPPFDDLRVRQAFNLALNREELLQTFERGEGSIQHGPLSPSVVGYWPGVEELGGIYNPERAEALLAEAGYVRGDNGILERDGEPLQISILALSQYETLAELMKNQYGDLGAMVEIELGAEEKPERLFEGDYQLILLDVVYSEADLLYLFYHSTNSLVSLSQLSDPVLDDLLEKTRTTQDSEERQEWVNRAQEYIVEQSYMLPLYASKNLILVNKQLQGLQIRPDGSLLYEGVHREPVQ